MSAELLRRAATRIRERAEAASPGPWGVDEPWQDVYAVTAASDRDVGVATPGEWDGSGGLSHANAEHVASWHPDVALAAARWLNFTATVIEAHEINQDCPCIPEPTYHAAAQFACAYLGLASDDDGRSRDV